MSLDLKEDLENMIIFSTNCLDFIDNQENTTESFYILQKIFDEKNIKNNKYYLISLFHFIVEIANNHHRNNLFFEKIETIIQFFRNEIKIYFSNYEIFDIFKSNSRILLFCFDEKIIIVDQYIFDQIKKQNSSYYRIFYYLWPEIKPFIKDKGNIEFNEKIPENYYVERKIAENDSYICKLIRNDSIDEFAAYCTKTKQDLDSKTDFTYYETNSFLIK